MEVEAVFFSYLRCFSDNNEAHILYKIQARILNKKEYSLHALDIGISSGLFSFSIDDMKVVAEDRILCSNPSEEIKRLGRKAELLGEWFSEHPLKTIVNSLEVSF